MNTFYVIKDLRDNSYVAYDLESYMTISSAYEFDSEQDAIEFAENYFDSYSKFTIEKVYELNQLNK
jgi:hypothetical protein